MSKRHTAWLKCLMLLTHLAVVAAGAAEHADDYGLTDGAKHDRNRVAFSQIPILAWGVERGDQRNGDQELLQQCLGRLERFRDWYWRERDRHDHGLITLGACTGTLQHAKWETFHCECTMDGMTMTVHPKRKGPNEGSWYADICDKTIANSIKNGISEHDDSVTGKALGVPDSCMSSTLVTMMLDGLAKEPRPRLRGRKPAPRSADRWPKP